MFILNVALIAWNVAQIRFLLRNEGEIGFADAVAEQYGVPVLAKLPIDPKLAEAVDAGAIEDAKLPEALKTVYNTLESL